MLPDDIIGILARYHLPYTRVMALQATCKHFHAYIGPSLVSSALLRFGRVTVHERMVHVRDTNTDELVKVGLVHPNSTVLMLRYNGGVYCGALEKGASYTVKSDFVLNGDETMHELVHKFRHCYVSHTISSDVLTVSIPDLFNHKLAMSDNRTRVWFRFLPCTAPNTIYIRLCIRFAATKRGRTYVVRMRMHLVDME